MAVIRNRICLGGAEQWLLPSTAAVVLLIGSAAPMPLELIAAVLVVAALTRRHLPRILD
jgi:hypothetical protein